MPSAALTWIEPGASATLIWHGAAASQPGGGRLYVVSGPILEQPPASPYFIGETFRLLFGCQDVTISNFLGRQDVNPTYDVVASSERATSGG